MPNQNANSLISFLTNLTASDLIRVIAIPLILLYIFFAYAIWRQVQLMASVVEVGDTAVFNIISIIHLLASILVLLLVFILI
jgi:hypothetical protein